MLKRKLFCEISPLTYKISVCKCRLIRHMKNLIYRKRFAKRKGERLPYLAYEHHSLIRRTLGNVNAELQENKATNLALAAEKINGILIYPKETFSFWALVGNCTKEKGYKEGLLIQKGEVQSGIGGGMCQFTNLIHWLVLHSDLDITEHHHHDGFDLFPDFDRKVPFGTGTSILYNYLDYRFTNPTDKVYQLLVWTDETHLNGELRSSEPLDIDVSIDVENEYFIQEEDAVFRNGRVIRRVKDKRTNEIVEKKIIKENHAKVLYSVSIDRIKNRM